MKLEYMFPNLREKVLEERKLSQQQAKLYAAYRRDNYMFLALLICGVLLLILVFEWVGK